MEVISDCVHHEFVVAGDFNLLPDHQKLTELREKFGSCTESAGTLAITPQVTGSTKAGTVDGIFLGNNQAVSNCIKRTPLPKTNPNLPPGLASKHEHKLELTTTMAFDNDKKLETSGYKNNCGLNCLSQYIIYMLTTDKLTEGLSKNSEYTSIYAKLVREFNTYYGLENDKGFDLEKLKLFFASIDSPVQREIILAPVLRKMLLSQLKDDLAFAKSRSAELETKKNTDKELTDFNVGYLTPLSQLDNAKQVEQEELERLSAKFGIRVMVYTKSPNGKDELTHPSPSCVETETLPIGTLKIINMQTGHWESEAFPGYDYNTHNSTFYTTPDELNCKDTAIPDEARLKELVKEKIAVPLNNEQLQGKIKQLKTARIAGETSESTAANTELTSFFDNLPLKHKYIYNLLITHELKKSDIFYAMLKSSFASKNITNPEIFKTETTILINAFKDAKIITQQKCDNILSSIFIQDAPQPTESFKLQSNHLIINTCFKSVVENIDTHNSNTTNTTTAKVSETNPNTIEYRTRLTDPAQPEDSIPVIASITQSADNITTKFTDKATVEQVTEIASEVIKASKDCTLGNFIPVITKNNPDNPSLSTIELEHFKALIELLLKTPEYPSVSLPGFTTKDVKRLFSDDADVTTFFDTLTGILDLTKLNLLLNPAAENSAASKTLTFSKTPKKAVGFTIAPQKLNLEPKNGTTPTP